MEMSKAFLKDMKTVQSVPQFQGKRRVKDNRADNAFPKLTLTVMILTYTRAMRRWKGQVKWK